MLKPKTFMSIFILPTLLKINVPNEGLHSNSWFLKVPFSNQVSNKRTIFSINYKEPFVQWKVAWMLKDLPGYNNANEEPLFLRETFETVATSRVMQWNTTYHAHFNFLSFWLDCKVNVTFVWQEIHHFIPPLTRSERSLEGVRLLLYRSNL